MKPNITAKVPDGAQSSYTLYAQGLKIAAPKRTPDGGFLEFKFLGGTVVALFYTFAEFRRAYLVTGWDEGDGEAIRLPGVDSPLSLVYKAKGRKIDDLKRALRWLCGKDEFLPFRKTLRFWQSLSAAVDCGLGKKTCVEYLSEKYPEEII